MIYRALVLRTEPSKALDDYVRPFNAALQELRGATGAYFVMEQGVPEDPDVDTCTWTDERLGQGEISLVENRRLRVIYAQLGLVTESVCDTAARAIAKHVPIMSLTELKLTAERANGSDGGALARLGLAGPAELDVDIARLVSTGLASSDRGVREGAIYATFLLKWPAFQPPIATALAREDHDDLRRMLEAAATVTDPSWTGFDGSRATIEARGDMRRDTIVTDAPISDPDAPFYKALEAAMKRFTEQGFELELEEHGPTLGYDLLSFIHRPTGARVRIWEDYRAKVKYIEVEAPETALLDRMTSTLRSAIEPPSADELIARARRSRSDPTALMRAVYAGAEPRDERVIELVSAALTHRHPSMRTLAAYGAGILGWRDLEGPLEAAMKSEQDATAKEMMRRTLTQLGTPQRAHAP